MQTLLLFIRETTNVDSIPPRPNTMSSPAPPSMWSTVDMRCKWKGGRVGNTSTYSTYIYIYAKRERKKERNKKHSQSSPPCSVSDPSIPALQEVHSDYKPTQCNAREFNRGLRSQLELFYRVVSSLFSAYRICSWFRPWRQQSRLRRP